MYMYDSGLTMQRHKWKCDTTKLITHGVVRCPRSLAMISTLLSTYTATALKVVPRSMPTPIFLSTLAQPPDIFSLSWGVLWIVRCVRSCTKKSVKKTIRASVPIEKTFSGFFFLRSCSRQTQIKPNGGSTAAGLQEPTSRALVCICGRKIRRMHVRVGVFFVFVGVCGNAVEHVWTFHLHGQCCRRHIRFVCAETAGGRVQLVQLYMQAGIRCVCFYCTFVPAAYCWSWKQLMCQNPVTHKLYLQTYLQTIRTANTPKIWCLQESPELLKVIMMSLCVLIGRKRNWR